MTRESERESEGERVGGVRERGRKRGERELASEKVRVGGRVRGGKSGRG